MWFSLSTKHSCPGLNTSSRDFRAVASWFWNPVLTEKSHDRRLEKTDEPGFTFQTSAMKLVWKLMMLVLNLPTRWPATQWLWMTFPKGHRKINSSLGSLAFQSTCPSVRVPARASLWLSSRLPWLWGSVVTSMWVDCVDWVSASSSKACQVPSASWT